MSEAIKTRQLKEAVSNAPSKAGLYKKLAEVMGAMSRLKKTGRNAHFKYDFATAEDVSDQVRAELAERGVWFSAEMVGARREGTKTFCDFVMLFADGETGAEHAVQWSSEADDRQDKGINKAATAAVKYFLLKNFLISTGDEPDADAEGPVRARKQTPTPPKADLGDVAKGFIAEIFEAASVEALMAIAQDIKSAKLSPAEAAQVRGAWSERKAEVT